MRTGPASLLLLLAILPGIAAASSRALPELPRRTIPMADESALKKKKVMEPVEPEVDCVPWNQAPARKGDSSELVKKKCLPQTDSFRRAGEAASYLGHYYTNFTPFAHRLHSMKDSERAEFHESIRNCVTGNPACGEKEKTELLQALVQYNFGKELRAQVLENNSRAERMKTASADLPASYWRGFQTNAQRVMTGKDKSGQPTLRTGSLRTTTFRLDPKKDYVLDWTKAPADQRARLGNEFMQEYRGFIENYSKTTQTKSRWHYVRAESSALLGSTFKAADDPANLDPKMGKHKVDRDRHFNDMRSQSTESVNEIIHSYKEALHKDGVQREREQDGKWKKAHVAWKDVNPNDILTADTGFGLARDVDEKTGEPIDPKTVARGIIVSINDAIVRTEENMAKKGAARSRLPAGASGASRGRPPMIPSVTVDVEKFDKFLDAIWPADVAKPQ